MCQFLFKQRSKGADWEAANTAMANAAQVMETVLDTYTTGHVGILVRPSADQDSAQAKAEIERALADLPASEARWDVALDTAETPHPWVIVRDSGLPAVANATRITGNLLVAMGLGPRVLATVYAFTWKDRKVYWVYQPRIKAFTPFAPAVDPEAQERDHSLELRMEQAIRRDIPTSKDIRQWYPIWGIPF